MIRNLLLITILLFINHLSFGQYFQGVIVYKREYTPYEPSVSAKELERKYGTIQEYYVKDGNYKSIIKNGDSILAIHTFRHADYKMYSQIGGEPDILIWDNYKRVSDTLVKYQLKEKYDELMGETCDLLTLETLRSTKHYLLSNKYRVDPEFFQAHVYGLYNQQMNLAQGRLSLETISNYAEYGVVNSALSITEQQIQDSFFEVDLNKILIPTDALLEKLPEPVGGLKLFYRYISDSLRYPKEARRKGIEGKTIFGFIIDEQGNITHLKKVAGIGYGCDQEAERVIKAFQGKWEPATMNGQKVKCYVTLPIIFRLY